MGEPISVATNSSVRAGKWKTGPRRSVRISCDRTWYRQPYKRANLRSAELRVIALALSLAAQLISNVVCAPVQLGEDVIVPVVRDDLAAFHQQEDDLTMSTA